MIQNIETLRKRIKKGKAKKYIGLTMKVRDIILEKIH